MPITPEQQKYLNSLSDEQFQKIIADKKAQEVKAANPMRGFLPNTTPGEGLRNAVVGGLRGFMGQDPIVSKGTGDMADFIQKEQVKKMMEPAKKWEPTTREDALAFEREKAGIRENTPTAQKAKMDLEDATKRRDFEAQNVKETAQDTLDTIAEVEKGIHYFGAGSLIPAMPNLQPDKMKWQSNLHKLLSGKIVELITTMKSASKTGATGFGQLSDREGQILREASTALRGISSPQEAQEILGKMKVKLQKVVSGGSNISGNDERDQAKQLLIDKGYSEQEAEQMLGQ